MHQPLYPWERTQVAVQSKFFIIVKMYFWKKLKKLPPPPPPPNTVPSPLAVIPTCFTNLTIFQVLFLSAVFPCQQIIASNTDLNSHKSVLSQLSKGLQVHLISFSLERS